MFSLFHSIYIMSLGETPQCTFKTCQAGKELCEKGQNVFRCRHTDLVANSSPCLPEKTISADLVR